MGTSILEQLAFTLIKFRPKQFPPQVLKHVDFGSDLGLQGTDRGPKHANAEGAGTNMKYKQS